MTSTAASAPSSRTPERSTPSGSTVTAGRRARRRRAGRVVAVLVVLVLGLVLLSLTVGERIYSPVDVLRVILGQDVPGASFTVGRLRLPRTITSVFVGVSLGLAGTLFQTMLRNPLASPDIIGISFGSSAAAVTAIALFGAGGPVVSFIALAGGLLVALVVYALSYRRGVLGSRLVLIGIAVGTMLVAVINFVLTRTSVYKAAEALRWLTGSLNSSFWDDAASMTLAAIILVPLALLVGRRLEILELGDDSSTALGVPADRTRLIIIVVAVALVSTATASAGPVAFVAFLAGPIAARLTPGRSLLVPAALVGAALVLGADFIGSHLLPYTLPVGVVTGAVGAPYLLWLLARSNRKGGRL
ncbi:FecCD family ABC transporter permease [Amnibacterium flavum]|uniref:ABC transporter permease n=1 Tax=Amnibacterium flavum TaxID=2173173 RepID=A0A2V1HWG8_9MICO|nr:iron chelate uptake ABC transporter family permease subunit [Amnibacterium flavum]PVZ94827.1 ABC transporter permease [Amnibacterium flavum]